MVPCCDSRAALRGRGRCLCPYISDSGGYWRWRHPGVDDLWCLHSHRRWGIRDQCQRGPAEDDPNTQPDPHDQRIEVRFEDRMTSVLIQPLIDEIKIFVQTRADKWHRPRLLAGFVEAALGSNRVNLPAILQDVEDGPLGGIVRELFIRIRAAD